MPSPEVTRQIAATITKEVYPPADYVDRIIYMDRFGKRPILAAELDPSTIDQSAQRLLTGANLDWIISGTNADSTHSTLDEDGGIAVNTDGADDDQVILSPATAINSVLQSPFGAVEWQPDHASTFEATIELPSLVDIQMQVGFALTTAQDLTTDADYVKFQFSTEGANSTSNWTGAIGIGGADTEVDLGVAPTASTSIRLGIEINTSRKAQFYIDGLRVGDQTDPLTSGVNLIPTLGIQALTGSAVMFKTREVICTRLKNAS